METMTKIFPLSETGEFQSPYVMGSLLLEGLHKPRNVVSRIPDFREHIMKPDRYLELVDSGFSGGI